MLLMVICYATAVNPESSLYMSHVRGFRMVDLDPCAKAWCNVLKNGSGIDRTLCDL